MKKGCSAEGCDDPALARGLCSAHYQRAKAAGRLDEVAPNPSKDCQHCGKPIPPGRRWGAAYCSTDCKQASIDARRHAELTEKRANAERSCAWCREVLGAEMRYGTRFCSSLCSDSWHNNQKRLAMLRAKKARRGPCEVCDGPIPPERPANAIYCSPECKRRAAVSHHPKVRRGQQEYNRRYLYGLSDGQYQALLASQGGRCAICGTTEWNGKSPHVDHGHDCCPGDKSCGSCIRGLLCDFCNRGVGMFADDPARLRAAAGYLERYSHGTLFSIAG